MDGLTGKQSYACLCQGDLAHEADAVASWAEGCPCHSADGYESDLDEEDAAPQVALQKLCPGPCPIPSECNFRGCRAVELALGHGLQIQRQKLLDDRVPCFVHVVLGWGRTGYVRNFPETLRPPHSWRERFFSHPWFDFVEFELNWLSNTLVVAAGIYIPACPEWYIPVCVYMA